MRKRLWLVALAAALGSTAQMYSGQFAKAEEIVVASRYIGPGGSEIEGLGVCRIAPESVVCWDMDGIPSQDLADRVRRGLLVSSNAELRFRLLRRCRYLIVRENSRGHETPSWPNSGESAWFSKFDASIYTVHAFDTDDLAARGSYQIYLNDVTDSPSATLPFQQGVRRQVGPVQIQLGPIREEPPVHFPVGSGSGSMEYYQLAGLFNAGKTWRIAMGAGGRAAAGPLRFQVFDRGGRSIAHVDARGEPVSDEAYDKWLKSQAARSWVNPPLYAPAQVQVAGPATEDAVTAFFNVDPAYIGSIKVTALIQRHVTITGFPLEPR